MQVPQDSSSNQCSKEAAVISVEEQRMKAITYSLDALVPGLYCTYGVACSRLDWSKCTNVVRVWQFQNMTTGRLWVQTNWVVFIFSLDELRVFLERVDTGCHAATDARQCRWWKLVSWAHYLRVACWIFDFISHVWICVYGLVRAQTALPISLLSSLLERTLGQLCTCSFTTIKY